MRRAVSARIPLLGLLCVAVAAPASAHISLEKGGTHLSRYGDSALKEAPCGQANGPRGEHVYTYAPGETISVAIQEYIPHPSYFRIAFDDDGDDGFKDPASILPIDPTRKCPDGPGDHCGASDFDNTKAVLMDNLNPHIPTVADLSNPKTFTWEVTLPNVECDNCTLQIIQVMEDDAFHGPYDPTPGVGVADVYHQCIDLVLKRADAGAPVSGPGGADAGAKTGQASSGDGGGCSVAPRRPGTQGSPVWAALALAFGGLAMRRRRSAG
jgi:MYXO-CTERM domain-containing protein